jgi:hypothetical protein
MAYHFKSEEHATYLHAIGAGERTEENARRFLIDAYRASVERQRDSLLVEVRFSGPHMDLRSIYSVIAERSPDGATLRRIAYVDGVTAPAIDPAEFAELAARNRGVNVRLFRNVSEAKRWLEDPD